jgi:hypothetical protein
MKYKLMARVPINGVLTPAGKVVGESQLVEAEINDWLRRGLIEVEVERQVPRKDPAKA